MKKLVFFFLPLLLLSCSEKSPIEGLWLVSNVNVGSEEMTPNARWMRLNSDFTQESGNGLFQHSFGTYKFDQDKSELKMKDTYGLEDPFSAFKVSFENETMIWNREEEGEPVEVRLNRIDKLPRTYGDQVLGLWKLESKQGEGPIYKDENKDDFLFLRWDKRFVARNNGTRLSGIYNVHGHRAELELIPYGKDLERSFWRLELEEEAIQMQLLNSDTTVVREFKRIHRFP